MTCKRKKEEIPKPDKRVKLGLVKDEHPELIKELSPDNTESIDHVTCGSRKRFLWVCAKNHTWSAPVHTRVRGHGCRICAGTCTSEENRLDIHYPKLSKEFHPERNGDLKTHQLSVCRNGKAVWWLCKNCGYEWRATVANRVKGSGCHNCGRITYRMTEENRLTTCSPEIAKEFDLEKNFPLKPENFTRGSGRVVFWLGSCGHSWQASIVTRTTGSGCPVCAYEQYEHGTSKAEKMIAAAVKSTFNTGKQIIENHLYNPQPHILQKFNLAYGTKFPYIKPDIYIQKSEIFTRDIFIEYDGYRGHGEEVGINRDTSKSHILLAEGAVVVRIRRKNHGSLKIEHPHYYEMFGYCSIKKNIQPIIDEIYVRLKKDGHIIDED